MAQIWKRILLKIQPDGSEIRKKQSQAHEIVRKLQANAKNAKAVLAGSVAKGTFLKGEGDIDVFLLFPFNVPKSSFEALAKQTVKKAFSNARYEIKYAEHPYIRLFTEGMRVDVVPAYKITTAAERLSAVDRSVLHTVFIQKSLKKKQIADVLLLKKFLKANELYGAEIRVQGFSGYLCELLILYYRNFISCLRGIAKFKMPVFIDIKKFYKTKADKNQAVKNFHSPLIVIDPTDKTRNVAAAVSEENLKKLISLAKKFTKKPTEKFFSGPKTFKEKIQNMKNAYTIELMTKKAVDDIIWGQLRKLSHQLLAFLRQNEFDIVQNLLNHEKNKAVIVISFKTDKLKDKKLLKGPRLSLKKNVLAFKHAHKHGKFKIRQHRIYAEVKRELYMAKQALKKFLSTATLPSHFEKTGIQVKKL